MELDKRIKEGKKPLTRLDAEKAVHFIGEECYFSDSLDSFEHLDEFKDKLIDDAGYYADRYKGKLLEIFANDDRYIVDEDNLSLRFDYCLPCEWVQEQKRPKWRAFKDHAEYKEFLNDGIIESWIKIREKETKDTFEVMYVGGGEDIIYLGGRAFSLSYLFEQYELFNESSREWRPFGVPEGDE